MKTPTARKSQGDGGNLEKTSGKKLIQARLPFAILTTPTEGVTASKEIDKKDGKKRKLSYEQEDAQNNDIQQESKRKSFRKSVTNSVDLKNKQTTKTKNTEIVVILSDSSNNSINDDINSKENQSKVFKEKQEKNADCEVANDIELIESSEDGNSKNEESVNKKTSITTTKSPTAKKNAKTPNAIKTPTVTKKPITPKATNTLKTPSTPKTPITTKTSTTKKTPTTDKKQPTRQIKDNKTPQSNSKKQVKGRKSASNETPEPKLQIKLPIGGKNNKRRKAIFPGVSKEPDVVDDLSDDVEQTATELHPQKRPKLDSENISEENQTNNENQKEQVGTNQEDEVPICNDKENKKDTVDEHVISKNVLPRETNDMDKTKGKNSKQNEQASVDETKGKNSEQNEQAGLAKKNEVLESKENQSKNIEDDKTSEIDLNTSKTFNVSNSTTDIEADAETEVTINGNKNKDKVKSDKIVENSQNESMTSLKPDNDSKESKTQKRILTPKQQILHDRRMKAREDKERKIQEERLQKQKEKEDRELAKKREREEKEEQRRKEREDREEQRRKEREEKESKRLAEVEAKNEEKRKKNEAREEELRKKEEERKRKEQEKEEAEMKKKKAALAFTKFFSRSNQDVSNANAKECSKEVQNIDLLAFRPFQIKGDMKLAPTVRKQLTLDNRSQLEAFIEADKTESTIFSKPTSDLYLNQLKSGLIKPCKWCPSPQTDICDPKEANVDADVDVIVIEDELERAGEAIVEETNGPIERFRVKYLKFHENRRPPYYGTWRKKSKVITARRPFGQDKKIFEYEVDSDDEWEEEEPGESLDGSDDDKEKESEDDDYEVDNEWFVPHGHLSEEELQNEDDLGDNNDREAQKAKLQILQQEFAQEMKKKTKKIKPRLIGCIWVDENGNQPENCPKIIWDTLNLRSILSAEPPVVEEIDLPAEKNGDATNANNGQSTEKTNGEIKLQPITLTDPMLKQLARLMHGNSHSKNFLIQEFIAYIEANEESVQNGLVRGPLKSAVREKIDQLAQWQIVEKQPQSNEGDNVLSKKKKKKKLCWVVSDEALQKMELEAMELNNNWDYILKPRHKSNKTETSQEQGLSTTAEFLNDNKEESMEKISAITTNSTETTQNKVKIKSDIKKFTKILTAEEKAEQLRKNTEQTKNKTKDTQISKSPPKPINSNITNTNSINEVKTNNSNPVVKKRVPLLMSVARGQTISTPDKNARISQYLKSVNDAKEKQKQNSTKTTPEVTQMNVDDVVVLD